MQLLNKLQAIDVRLFTWFFGHSSRRLIRAIAKSLSRSGDGYLHLAIPLLLLAVGAPHCVDFLLIFTLASICERLVYWILKNTLQRRRPQDYVPNLRSLVTASDKFSFPSGHSSAAFLLATTLSQIYGLPFFAVYLWATGVALSRVLLGVHFPGDILAGALMGTGIAIVSIHGMGLV